MNTQEDEDEIVAEHMPLTEDLSRYKPTYPQLVRDFISYFHATFMMPAESGMSDL